MLSCGVKWENPNKNSNKINMIGNYTNKLDDKGRMTIPAKFRNELGEFVVVSYGFDNSLEIRKKEIFDIWSNSLIENGNLNKEARELQRLILGLSFDVVIDKSGRILLPKSLLDVAKIEKEISIVGIGNKLEIHSTTQWNNFAKNDNANSLSEKMERLASSISK